MKVVDVMFYVFFLNDKYFGIYCFVLFGISMGLIDMLIRYGEVFEFFIVVVDKYK